MHIINEPLIAFRVHADQISNTSINRQLKHALYVSKNGLKKFLGLDIDIKSIELIILANRGHSSSKFKNIKKSISDLNYIRRVFIKKNEFNISTAYFYKTILMIIKSSFSHTGLIKNFHLILFAFKNNHIIFYFFYFDKKLYKIRNI